LISIDGVVQATNFSVNSSTIDFGVNIPSTSTCNFFLHYGTGVMTVPSDGSVTSSKLASGNLTIPNGNLLFDTASKGIYLGVTSATSSNLLNDYEEGTWTPVVSDATSGGNTASTSSSVGEYTKIGNTVYVQCNIDDINTSGMGTGNFYIQGLPFASSSGSVDVVGSMNWNNITLASDETDVAVQLVNGVTYLRPVGNKNDGGSKSILNSSQLTSGSADIDIAITYLTT